MDRTFTLISGKAVTLKKWRTKMAICRGCKEEILWVKTAFGKDMPCNPDKVNIITEAGTVAQGWVSHFATCKDAKKFRNKRTT